MAVEGGAGLEGGLDVVFEAGFDLLGFDGDVVVFPKRKKMT